MNGQDILRVALEAVCSERTVKRWLEDPDSVNSNSLQRIQAAVRKLKIRTVKRQKIRTVLGETRKP